MLLLTVVLPPAVALIWLGYRLIESDYALAEQRHHERNEAAAQAIWHALDRSLTDAARSLSLPGPPDGLVRIEWASDTVTIEPARAALWVPAPARGLTADEAVFADAEMQEYRGGDTAARARYADLARSPDPAVRAGALLRLARVDRRARRWEAALRSYRALAAIGNVTIDGAPADLQARRAIADVLHSLGRTEALSREAVSLENDLLSGQWTLRLSRTMADAMATDLESWTGHAAPGLGERALMSAVADEIWNEVRLGAHTSARPGWRLIETAGTALTVFVSNDVTRAVVITPAMLSGWIDRAGRDVPASPATLAILTPAGKLVYGAMSIPPDAAVRLSTDATGLPWQIAVASGDPTLFAAELDARRVLFISGLVAILILLGGTSYLFWHFIRRELAVARLQSEFVATVSHEFRTPLTSLRHVTELLKENDEVTPEERRSFYGALDRSSKRLQRLVESLLDFARLEAGRSPYEMRPLDIGAFTARVVADFEGEVGDRGRVTLKSNVAAVTVNADATSLAQALWNLVDNAAKYSEPPASIAVSVRATPRVVELAVRDRGFGIPVHEQATIFNRFVRGRIARHRGIGGTGLGLAIVGHIVSAHGGTLSVKSTEGAGSTFLIALPVVETGSAEAADLQPCKRES